MEVMKNAIVKLDGNIDVISDETFEYITASDMTWGGFNWKLVREMLVLIYIDMANYPPPSIYQSSSSSRLWFDC